MPHLTLEYTANLGLDAEAALLALNHALADSGLFEEADIKSRALPLHSFRTGTAATPRAFAHARLALMPGRDAASKRHLADALLAALSAQVSSRGLETQLCVELQEIAADCYAKEHRHG